MKEITMRDLIHLCSRFQVKFSVEVSLHLAATYPEKVLTNG